MAQSIQGTATYRERMALPPAAVFEAVLEDVSRADAKAETIARTRLTSPGNPPIAFTIAYEPAKIQSNHRYVVRVKDLPRPETPVHNRHRCAGLHRRKPGQGLADAAQGWCGSDSAIRFWSQQTAGRDVLEGDRAGR